MEPNVCGFSISNVCSIAEDGTATDGTWCVKLEKECDLDKEVDDEFACEDTVSVTEPQVEIEYSEVSFVHCGLSLDMFKSLLEYIEDEIEPMEDATKFTQLFSALTKLHTNQESIYLNKYVFPFTFVQIIELLYKKLKVLCKISASCNRLPEIFVPTFTHDQRLIIVGTISIHTADCGNAVKYLIGYSAFGEVFFVSHSFAGFSSIETLIQFSGILNKLEPEEWIVYFKRNAVYRTQVKSIKLSKVSGSKFQCDNIKKYVINMNSKLQQHFIILAQPVLKSMLNNKGDISFLDKLTFVCSMLMNMLPRNTYY